jgi:hypothetical protein
MKRFVAAVALIVGTVTLATAPALSASAAPRMGSAVQPRAIKYCYTEIEKIHPGQAASRVISRTCSDRHSPGSVLPLGVTARGLASKRQTLLVTFFQDSGYRASRESLGGSSGPCDVAGYSFSDLTGVNADVHGISSYQLFNSCRFASYWTGTGFTGSKRSGYPGNNTNVGVPWNDHLYSMRTWS